MNVTLSLKNSAIRSALLVLIISMLVSGLYLWISMNRMANEQSLAFADTLARQTSLTLRPLVLADDKVSINFVLRQLAESPQFHGAQLQDAEGHTLGKAGDNEGLQLKRTLVRNERPLATLTVWVDSTDVRTPLMRQFQVMMMLMCISVGAAALSLYLGALAEHIRKSIPEPGAIRRRMEGALEKDAEARRLDEAQLADSLVEEIRAPSPPPEPPHGATQYPLHSESALYSSDPEPTPSAPATAVHALGSENQSPVTPSSKHSSVPVERSGSLKEEEMDFETALEQQKMQRIADQSFNEMEPAIDSEAVALEPEVAAPIETEPQSEAAPPSEVSSIAALDAAYLVRVDTHPIKDSEGSAGLLENYRQLAQEAAFACDGVLEVGERDELLIYYREPDPNDEHGLRALCCAMLIVRLFRAHNQKRLSEHQTTLALPVVIARGSLKDSEHLLATGRQLGKVTNPTHELIAQKALVDLPEVGGVLLRDGHFEPIDARRVKILELGNQYEGWLRRQTNVLTGQI